LQQVALPVQLPGNHIGYQIIQAPSTIPPTPVQGTPTISKDHPSLNPRLLSTIHTGLNPPNYVTVQNSVNSATANVVTSKDTLYASNSTPSLQPTTLITAEQSNPLQIPQVPCVFPVSYVMYPPGVPTNGMHLTALQQPAKVLPSTTLVSQQQPPRPALKRPVSPITPSKPPSRNASNGSASSTTLSADSVDLDNNKSSGPSQPKKARLSDSPLANVSYPNNIVMAQHGPRFAQSQFIVPGNPGFMVAAPTSNGFSLPLNFLGYPVQAYPGAGNIQALSMAAPGFVPGQALHGIGQNQVSFRAAKIIMKGFSIFFCSYDLNVAFY